MIRSTCLGVALSSIALLLCRPATAQDADQPRAPVAPESHQLSEGAPRVGTPLPDIEIHTDTGDPFRSSALKGKFTVLVFGCLT